MIQEYQLRILPEIAASEQQLKAYLSQEKGLNQRDITALRTLKRSIDARQRTIYVNLKVRVYLNEMPKDDEYEHTIYNKGFLEFDFIENYKELKKLYLMDVL